LNGTLDLPTSKYVYDHYYIEKPLQFIGNPRYEKEAQMIGKLSVVKQFTIGDSVLGFNSMLGKSV
jgi:hypothetical protein